MRAPLTAAVLALVLALTPMSAAAGGDGWLTSVETARTQAAAGDRLILVDLYAEWCGWCKVLERQVFSTPRFRDYAAEKFVLLRVDVDDGGEGSALQERFGADSLPTTLVLDADLVRVGKVQGFSPLEPFIAALEERIARYAEVKALYRRAAASGDEELLALAAGELHERGDGRRAAELYARLLSVTGADPATAGRLHLERADALRLAGDFAGAARELAASREIARARNDAVLIEAGDLLGFRLAREQGDCAAARTAIRAFLSDHPQSAYRGYARRTLRALDDGGVACST